MSGLESNREYPRADIVWPVKARLNGVSIDLETKNISAGGAWLYPEFPVQTGELLSITLEPPNRTPITTTAKVVWKSLVFQDGLGIGFVEISTEDRQFLLDAVAKHLHSDSRRGRLE